MMFTPSSGIVAVEDISTYQLVDSEVELIGFSSGFLCFLLIEVIFNYIYGY